MASTETQSLNVLGDLMTDQTANANTPETVQPEPEPAVFDVPVDTDIPSTTLQGNTTFDDVRAQRTALEQQQQNAPDLTQFEEVESVATVFNDPDSFIESALFGDRELTTAGEQAADIRSDITETVGQTEEMLTSTTRRAEDTTQLSEREQLLASTNNDIAARTTRFRRELRAFEEDSERRGVARNFFIDEKNKLTADAKAELADLYIIQNAQQDNVQAARGYIKTAVDNRYRSIEIELKQKQAALNELIPTLEAEEKERAQQLQFALGERERNLQTEKEEATAKRNLMLEVAGMGGGDALQKSILNAPTEDQAALLASNYIGRQMRAASAASGSGSIKAPTIKQINGVDYQWNDQLGIWEEVNVAGGKLDADKVTDAVANLDFLLDTTDRILGNDVSSIDGSEKAYDKLYKGSAQTYFTSIPQNVFMGTTKQKRLEAQVDTLRANMLTLATDPAIKEFFGPQMSDADVRLMTAAGTSLRPGSQSDNELKDETVRIQDWVNRAKTAVGQGSTVSSRIVTAPDGTRVEIID